MTESVSPIIARTAEAARLCAAWRRSGADRFGADERRRMEQIAASFGLNESFVRRLGSAGLCAETLARGIAGTGCAPGLRCLDLRPSRGCAASCAAAAALDLAEAQWRAIWAALNDAESLAAGERDALWDGSVPVRVTALAPFVAVAFVDDDRGGRDVVWAIRRLPAGGYAVRGFDSLDLAWRAATVGASVWAARRFPTFASAMDAARVPSVGTALRLDAVLYPIAARTADFGGPPVRVAAALEQLRLADLIHRSGSLLGLADGRTAQLLPTRVPEVSGSVRLPTGAVEARPGAEDDWAELLVRRLILSASSPSRPADGDVDLAVHAILYGWLRFPFVASAD